MYLEELNLKRTNFQGDLSNLTNLKTLDMAWVEHENWGKMIFPTSLEELTLDEDEVNFQGDLSHLTNLK